MPGEAEVLGQLPQELWHEVGVPFKDRIESLRNVILSNYPPGSGQIYKTPGLDVSDPRSLALQVDNLGSVTATVGGKYERLGDRPDLGGEIRKATRAWDTYNKENPGLYHNIPYNRDNYGAEREKFYDKRGFVGNSTDGSVSSLMFLDTRTLAPYADQQVYAALDPYAGFLHESHLPFVAKSRSQFAGTTSDPWLNIPKPTLYDSSGKRINIKPGAFDVIGRTLASQLNEGHLPYYNRPFPEILEDTQNRQLAMARELQNRGIVQFPEDYTGGLTTARGTLGGIPASWVTPGSARNPGYASPVPIANPLDITPARRQALAEAGYSDPNQWFLQYYNEPQRKIVDSSLPHFTQLPYDIQNNNAWGMR